MGSAYTRTVAVQRWNLLSSGPSLLPGSTLPPMRQMRPFTLLLVFVTTSAFGDESAQRLDWVEWADLSAAIKARLPEYCEGAYVEPAFALPRNSDPTEFSIKASAGSAEVWIDERAVLRGGVEIDQGNRSLSSEVATYYDADQRVVATGDVVLREPDILIIGKSGEMHLDSGALQVNDAQFLLHEHQIRGRAERIARDEAATLHGTQTTFTRCEPGNNGWSVHARTIEVEDGAQWGIARRAVVRVKDVPIFYTPYLRFPVTDERMSGFLFPSMRFGDEGPDIGLPYYLNLAPNYDAIVEPRWIRDRGVGVQGEFRHLSGWAETELGGAFLYDDDLYNGDLSKDDFETLGLPGPFESEDRWLVHASHGGLLGNFRTILDYTEVSDDDYFRDLGTDLSVSSRVELDQRGEIQYSAGGLFARFWAQGFQNLDDTVRDPYDRLPELAVSYQGDLAGPFEWSLGSSISRFDRGDDPLNVGVEAINGDRFHVEPRLQLPMYWPFGFLRLNGGYRYTSYDLEDVPVGFDDQPDRGLWMGTADTGLFFEREMSAFGNHWIHTLEPRLYYLYQQFEDQTELPRFDAGSLTFNFSQLFRDNRFAGIDRMGDADQLSAALTTRLLDSEYGQERLRFSIGQIFYFQDRDVTLAGPPNELDRQSSSQLAAEAALRLFGNWSIRSNAVYNHHDSLWDDGSASIRYQRDNRHIFNVGYRYSETRRPLINQSDVSVYWPVSKHWSVLGRWNYDIEVDHTIESVAGVEYNDCCWRFRLVYRAYERSPTDVFLEDTDTDVGVFLQIVFKGMAGIGGKVDSLMEDAIPGYQTEDIDEI